MLVVQSSCMRRDAGKGACLWGLANRQSSGGAAYLCKQSLDDSLLHCQKLGQILCGEQVKEWSRNLCRVHLCEKLWRLWNRTWAFAKKDCSMRDDLELSHYL
eukprot:1143459-Pelagomonas_calceolata.AAC.3